MRTILLFFLLLMSPGLFSQDSINHTDAAGLRQGKWSKTGSDGKKIYDGQFKDGKPCGDFRYYYPDGKLKMVSVLSEEGKTARTVSYASNGRKIAEGKYKNEKKDSTWKYYSDYDGVLLSEETYYSGAKTGASRTYYPDGNIAELLTYRDGKKDGEWIQYYEDNKIKFRGSYLNDDKEGPFSGYYPDGKLNITGAYKAGHKDGAWTTYGEKGEIISKESFAEGALIIEKKP